MYNFMVVTIKIMLKKGFLILNFSYLDLTVSCAQTTLDLTSDYFSDALKMQHEQGMYQAVHVYYVY